MEEPHKSNLLITEMIDVLVDQDDSEKVIKIGNFLDEI